MNNRHNYVPLEYVLTWEGSVSIEDNEEAGRLEMGRSGRLEMCRSGSGFESDAGESAMEGESGLRVEWVGLVMYDGKLSVSDDSDFFC